MEFRVPLNIVLSIWSCTSTDRLSTDQCQCRADAVSVKALGMFLLDWTVIQTMIMITNVGVKIMFLFYISALILCTYICSVKSVHRNQYPL